ncbi:Sodium Bile acid symporter family protein [Posidoniimonas corsicana]|uniref:Sodium Bile acid symporter family protein n=1 Tax=Posidoniimonas corsicana TaxID=1938618 RepID=A0A5C5VGB4_9BACT|nr:bile acid:sodium symporter [Posidoniimonas corsicana]TWT36990.1 Sodium Bile acid symporter family protein [Posidoniimonas corsicana]
MPPTEAPPAAAGPLARTAEVVHDYFLGLLAACYALALLAPGPGAWLRSVELGARGAAGGVSLSQVLLAGLLAIAGVGIDPTRVRESLLRPLTLGGALVVKLVLPIIVVSVIAWLASFWAGWLPAEMLLGLAIVAAMPAAASCPAWTQASAGDVALALGVVVGSTLLGPWAAQFWLPGFAQAAGADPNIAHGISRAVLGSYFLLWVLLPSALGVAARVLLGPDRIARVRPALRLAGSGLLLLLIYAFAAAALSLVEVRHAGERLATALSLAGALCAAAFLAGWLLARSTRASGPTSAALVYSVGMHNNGVALLLADTVLPRESAVFLPIICYALVQHGLAGIVDALFTRAQHAAGGAPATAAPEQ